MEIKIQDFRVGNLYIGYNDNFDIVDCDLFKMVEDGIDLDEIIKSPIPLSEEILLKCGFERENAYNTFTLNKLSICINDSYHKNGRVYFNSWAILEKRIDYLHQLQNLYLALTGQELNTSGL